MIKLPISLSTLSLKMGSHDSMLHERATRHIWFPCSQMKDYERLAPISVREAKGSYFTLETGETVIDAISSWWCKSLGHRHTRLVGALQKQLEKFEHIIGTNTANETLTLLSEKLARLHPGLDKVFYASEGSMAVEIALKMALHARKLKGQPHKNKIIALKNSYHGETIATLSISDLGLYKAPYQDYCFDTHFIDPVPYVHSKDDPKWSDISAYWSQIEAQLLPLVNSTTAIIVEPILQGAAGMKLYSKDFLSRLNQFAKAHDIYLICDEIMTGLGRTGKTLALEHADIDVDFICLSKALTSGNLPMSAVLTSNDIYDLFYDDYETGKAFLHSNTYCGNALAASIALEVLQIHEEEDINSQANQLGEWMLDAMKAIADETGCLTSMRHVGAMVAAELTLPQARAGFELFQIALKKGAFLRPLGNTLYWLPPLNTKKQTIEKLAKITLESIHTLKNT